MSEELRPCPFCGMNYAENAWDECGSEYWVCEFCGAASGTARDEYGWNTRPIEDALNKRIAELEALVNVSEGLYERIYEQAAHIAELEGAKCETCVHYVTYSYKFYSYPCSECKHRSRDSYMPLPESPKECEE